MNILKDIFISEEGTGLGKEVQSDLTQGEFKVVMGVVLPAQVWFRNICEVLLEFRAPGGRDALVLQCVSLSYTTNNCPTPDTNSPLVEKPTNCEENRQETSL